MGNVCSFPYIYLSIEFCNKTTDTQMRFFIYHYLILKYRALNYIYVSLLHSENEVLYILGNEHGTIAWQWSGGLYHRLGFCCFYILPLAVYCLPISKSLHWLDRGYKCCVLV